MIIPVERLNDDALRAIAEAYIVRDGTDYGDQELDMDAKVQQLLPQIHRGEVVIVYDEDTESVSLLTKDDADTLLRSRG